MKSVVALATVVLTLAPGPLSAPGAMAQTAVNAGERGLRRNAEISPMPEYPRESRAAKVAGVAVAEVVFAPNGILEIVNILQAPDEHTAAAVQAAVSRWKLPAGVTGPRGEPPPARRGKLTFYFRFDDGKGQVLNPHQMPGVVARPAPGWSPPSAAASGAPPPSGPPMPVAAQARAALKTITTEALKGPSGNADVLVLDIGEREAFRRGHWPGSINIPVDELPVRAGPELARSRPIVIDCTQEPMWRCQAAGDMLTMQKFTDVMLLVR